MQGARRASGKGSSQVTGREGERRRERVHTVMVVGAHGFALSCPILCVINFVSRMYMGRRSLHVRDSGITHVLALCSTAQAVEGGFMAAVYIWPVVS